MNETKLNWKKTKTRLVQGRRHDRKHKAQWDRDKRDHREHREGETLGNTREMTGGMTQGRDNTSLSSCGAELLSCSVLSGGMEVFCTTTWQHDCLKGETIDLHFSCFCIGKPRHQCTDAYVVSTATHADRLVMSGHTNPFSYSLLHSFPHFLLHSFLSSLFLTPQIHWFAGPVRETEGT